jgi:hypothetical protein
MRILSLKNTCLEANDNPSAEVFVSFERLLLYTIASNKFFLIVELR